jgi:hypothetical protein
MMNPKSLKNRRYKECRGGGVPTLKGYLVLLKILSTPTTTTDKNQFLVSLGLIFTGLMILHMKGDKDGINMIRNQDSVLRTGIGDHLYVYEYDRYSDTFSYSVHPPTIKCLKTCDQFKIDQVVYDSGLCDSFVSEVVSVDHTHSKIAKRMVATHKGGLCIGSGFKTKRIQETDFDIMTSGILYTGVEGRVGQKKSLYTQDEVFKGLHRIDPDHLIQEVKNYGDKALLAIGQIFVAIQAIKGVGVSKAIKVLNNHIDATSTSDGRYIFIMRLDKLTNTYTVQVHIKREYRGLSLRGVEDEMLRSIICKEVTGPCVLRDSSLYRYYRANQDLSGGLVIFNGKGNTSNFVYPDTHNSKLIHKRSIYMSYTDPLNVHMEYIVGSGWEVDTL